MTQETCQEIRNADFQPVDKPRNNNSNKKLPSNLIQAWRKGLWWGGGLVGGGVRGGGVLDLNFCIYGNPSRDVSKIRIACIWPSFNIIPPLADSNLGTAGAIFPSDVLASPAHPLSVSLTTL